MTPPTPPLVEVPDLQHVDDIETGDVIEISRDGEPTTVLVLLATESSIILDALDGSTPFVVRCDEIGPFRKYVPTD